MTEAVTAIEKAEIIDLPLWLESDDRSGYFQEAIECYKANAFRSAIIMAQNAIFSKLRDQLADLAQLGMAGAEKALADVVRLESSKANYEGEIFGYFKAHVLSPAQITFMGNIQRVRNDVAHASCRESSKEEAEDILRQAVKHILGRQDIGPGVAISLLIRHLERPNYFPDVSAEGVCSVVRMELDALPAGARARLIDELIDAAERPGKRDPKQVSGRDLVTSALNAENFLCGVFLIEDDYPSEEIAKLAQRIKDRVFRRQKSRDLTVTEHGHFVSLVAVRANLVKDIDPSLRMRIDQLFSSIFREVEALPEREASRHPAQLLQAMLSDPPEMGVVAGFPLTIETLIERWWEDKSVTEALLDAGLAQRLCDRIIDELATGGSSIEGAVAELLKAHDEQFAAVIQPTQAVSLITELSHSRFAGAIAELQQAEFFPIPRVRLLARSYLAEHMPVRLHALGLVREETTRASSFERATKRHQVASRENTKADQVHPHRWT